MSAQRFIGIIRPHFPSVTVVHPADKVHNTVANKIVLKGADEGGEYICSGVDWLREEAVEGQGYLECLMAGVGSSPSNIGLGDKAMQNIHIDCKWQ